MTSPAADATKDGQSAITTSTAGTGRTVYVIAEDLQIIETEGHPWVIVPNGNWSLPQLGYSTREVWFNPLDAMAEQTKRIEVEIGRLKRMIANEDGSPKGEAQRIRRV